jgi:hypothetical protein
MSTQITESIRFAGDVNIRRLEIVSSANYKVDVTNQLIGAEIYEDIFSPFITMAITIKESQDFINALPLRGEEILNMEISTPSFKTDKAISGKFYIYKLSDRQMINDRNVVYTIFCISYEALLDLNTKHSKGFGGNISEIAKKHIGIDGLNTSKNVNVEPTKNNIKYVSNFWSPIKNLNFLATAAANTNGSANYIFFENRSGFNFVSLDSLYTASPYQKFIKDNYVRDPNGQRNVERDYQRIIDFKVKVSYDALKSTNNGAYRSRIYAYDLVKKKYYAKDYDALSNFKNEVHLNAEPLYTSMKPISGVNAIFNEIRHYSSHNGFADTSSINTQQQRNSKLGLLRSSVVEISVFGRTDYTVGQKVYLEIPKAAVITDSDQMTTNNEKGIIDAAHSGYYIVTAINHVINRNDHTCVMELSKESMMG